MTEEIKKILKVIEGRVVAFGFKIDKFSKILELNKKITSFDVLEEVSRKRNRIFGKQKKIYIKDLKKIYKKKSINVVIINVDVMMKDMTYLIGQTIHMGKTLYLYGSKENVINCLEKYKRYQVTYEETSFGDNLIIEMDISNSKNNKLKDSLYIFKDKLVDFFNILSDFLTS